MGTTKPYKLKCKFIVNFGTRKITINYSSYKHRNQKNKNKKESKVKAANGKQNPCPNCSSSPKGPHNINYSHQPVTSLPCWGTSWLTFLCLSLLAILLLLLLLLLSRHLLLPSLYLVIPNTQSETQKNIKPNHHGRRQRSEIKDGSWEEHREAKSCKE
jgi:hypothetical protein